MFRIGEVSRLTQVSVRMSRYYDEEGLLVPAEVDRWTGHRLYSAEQIPMLNKILYLRDSGLNVKEIALALKMDGQKLLAMLGRKRTEIEKTIMQEQEKLKKIETARRGILCGGGDFHYNISLRLIPACKVLSVRKIVADSWCEGELWKELSSFAEKNKIAISGSTFSIYHDTEFKERNVDIELCAPVNTNGNVEPPFNLRTTESVLNMACTMVYGEFSNIRNGYLAFAEWLEKNSGYKMTAPTRQIVHRGPWNESDPEKYLTEIQIPLVSDTV